jgi:uncharacterized protein
MLEAAPPPDLPLLARRSRTVQWVGLLALSVVLAAALELGDLPAALLVGPMAAAVVAGTNGATIRVPRLAYVAAQAVVGCLVAASIDAELLSSFVHQWPVFLIAALATVSASGVLGWLVSRWRILPGATAILGSAPGAATSMVLMAEAFGADARLVAFMQYLRVILVSLAAAIVARLWVDTSTVAVPAVAWFPPLDASGFAATLLIATAGAAIGRFARFPAGAFLGPLILGTTLHLSGLATPQLPPWLLAASYAIIGWSIGLNFTAVIFRHALKALPQIVLAILMLLAFCAGMAFVLVKTLGVDPLTAYLATSPGGLDSVAIIAAASDSVNLSFVLALQMVRFLIVLLIGPPVARFFARRVKG